MHKQKYIKVNVLVDEKIIPLVKALSGFEQLQTIESCQRESDKSGGWVIFHYGPDWQNWKPLAEFVFGYFGPRLNELIGDSAHVSVYVNTHGRSIGEINLRPGTIEGVSDAIKSMVKEKEAP